MEKTWVWPEAQSDQWIVNFGGRFLMVGAVDLPKEWIICA